MKVATINFSGNNGKTTIAENLFVSRIQEPLYLTVESVNAGGNDVSVRGKDYGLILEEMMMVDNAIIDIGASNVEALVKLMRQYKGSHEAFDYFIVPVVPESKQINDTISTIRALHKLGVPPKKIKVVMNKVEIDDNLEDIFYPLFALHKSENIFTLSYDAVIETSEIYPLLKTYDTSINELVNSTTNWKTKLRDAKDENEKRNAIRMIIMTQLARGAKDNLDKVYMALFNN
ncbi:TPA: StbB family protein [Enterobacter hormaechei]